MRVDDVAAHMCQALLSGVTFTSSSRKDRGARSGGAAGGWRWRTLPGHTADFLCIVIPALAAMLAPATALPLLAGVAYAVINLALSAERR